MDKMTVYGELKACCLDSEGWAWIKRFDTQKDGRLATESLRTHYEGAGESNKRVAWATAAIANAHYRSEHTFSFEKFSTSLLESFTILNNNGETHSEGQMVCKMIEKIQVPNNGQMEACKRICSSMHGTSFVDAVTYLSAQVTEIFPSAQLEGKKTFKRRILELDTGRGQGRGRGRGRFSRGGGGGRGGRGGRGRGARGGHDDPPTPYNTFNGVNIRDPTREINDAEWEALGWDGRAYVTRVRTRRRGAGAGRGGGRGRGREVQEVIIPANNTSKITKTSQNTGRGDGLGRGSRNGVRFGGGGY